MPVEVIRLPDEPIIIATLSGSVTVEDIKQLYIRSNELIEEKDQTIFRITDVRNATTTFPEMIKSIQMAVQELPASSRDPRVRITFVGESTWVTFARDTFAKQGIKTAAFTDMEEALDSIRLQVTNPTMIE